MLIFQRGSKTQQSSLFLAVVGHLGYPDTEYEYFEQRGGLARPTLMNAGGGGPPLPPGMPMGGPGAPLLPQETAKFDNSHEEVRANKDTLEYLTDVTSLESSNRDRSIQCNPSRIPNIPIRSSNVLSNLPQKHQVSKKHFRSTPLVMSSAENSKDESFLAACNEISSVENSMCHE